MKKFYTMVALAFSAITAAAQSPDAVYVQMNFNENPWGLPVSAMKGWSNYADENGVFAADQTFTVDVNGEQLKMVLTPSNYKLTDYDNALVRGEDPDDGDKVKTILMTRTGSKMTFIAPPSMWMEKVAFETYRRWSSGSLYSDEKNTNNQHVWGKDSVKTREGFNWVDGKQIPTTFECWIGDSVEWSLPACTGQTYLHWIDFWLLPRNGAAGITEARSNTNAGNVHTLNGVLLRRNGKVEGLRKGIYIVNGKKVVF